MRVIEVITEAGNLDTVNGIAEHAGVLDTWHGPSDESGRVCIRMLVKPQSRQAVMDGLQSALGGSENSRVMIQPIEAIWPRPEEQKQEKKSSATTREELYTEVEKGARLDRNFVILAILSTVVVAIGLIEDNIAVVIGAMVIAPLLGPNIALALGTVLGDGQLAWKALRTNLVGVGLSFAVALIIGFIWTAPLDSKELISRTDVGLDGVALALASGMAAVLSLTTGLSTVLVGVMVAVALLPPAATAAIYLGAGYVEGALGAALLLAVNVVCVNLAAKLVFLLQGIRPRTWHEKQKAKSASKMSLLFWFVSLVILIVLIFVRAQLTSS